MKKLFVLFCWLLGLQAAAETVHITLVINPPYSANISSYQHLENKAILTVTNLSNDVQSVYLRGALTNETIGLYLRTASDYKPAQPIVLQPHQTRVVTSDAAVLSFLEGASLETNASDKLKQTLIQTNQLPEGFYRLCAAAYDFNTGAALSDENAGCSVLTITQANPPQITYPLKYQTIPYAQKVVAFSWTPPLGNIAGAQINYDLVVARVLPGQNPNDAVNAARDYNAGNPLLRKMNLPVQTYVLQPFDFQMEPGANYAMQVIAKDITQKLSFINDGRSEVITFSYDKKPDEVFIPPPQQANIPPPKNEVAAYVLKGRLSWGFRKSEEEGLMKADLGNYGNIGGSDAVGHFGGLAENQPGLPGSFGSGSGNGNSNSNGSGNKPGSGNGLVGYGSGGGQITGTFSTQPSGQGIGQVGNSAKTPQVSVSQLAGDYQQEQQRINGYLGSGRFPFANARVQLFKMRDPALAKAMKLNNAGQSEQLIGTVNADAQGNFSITYIGDVADPYVLQVRVDDKHFTFASPVMPRSQTKATPCDFGEVAGMARSFKLKVAATDENGKPLTGGTVTIYRTAQFYSTPKSNVSIKNEFGNNPDSVNTKLQDIGKSIANVPVATGTLGTVFSKAFYTLGYGERYFIYVRGDGLEGKQDEFMASSDADLPEKVTTLTYTMKMKLAAPKVTGRVVSKEGKVPLGGCLVLLHPSNVKWTEAKSKGTALTATTTSDGKFAISNVPVSNTPYVITVITQGVAFRDPGGDIFLNAKGVAKDRDPIVVQAVLLNVCGRVLDGAGQPVTNATLHWTEGGDPFYSDNDGSYFCVQLPGKHALTVQKPGYKDQTLTLDLQAGNPDDYASTATPDAQKGYQYFQDNINKQRSYSKGKGFGKADANSPSMNMGGQFNVGPINSIKDDYYTQAAFQDLQQAGQVFSGGVSCGHDVTLKGFYVRVTVQDGYTHKPLAGASVTLLASGSSAQTDSKGIAVVAGAPPGKAELLVAGPESGFYTATTTVTEINTNNDTTSVTVGLKPGCRAGGTVTANGKPVEGAEVYVMGKEFITTKTDKQGSYTLNGVPEGTYTLKAAKEGFISGQKEAEFKANKQTAVNLELKDAGFASAKLLGFTLELDESVPGTGKNEFVISGKISGIPDNDLLKKTGLDKNIKLNFVKQTVVKTDKGLVLKDAEMKLDGTDLKATLFGLKINLGSAGFKLRAQKADKNKGEIAAGVNINLADCFTSLSGIKMPDKSLKVLGDKSEDVVVFTSDGILPKISFGFAGNPDGWELYKIKLVPDFPACALTSDGVTLKADCIISGIPAVSDITIKISKLQIGLNGAIKDLKVDVNPKPVIKIANKWNIDPNALSLNEYGLVVQAGLKLPIPNSEAGDIAIKDLTITKSGINAGSFTLPAAGIDIFGVVKFKMKKPLSLQNLPGGAGFTITGDGNFKLPKYIDKDLTVEKFSFSTNGDFVVKVTTGFDIGFGDYANLHLKDITVANSSFGVDAKFTLAIPNLKAGIDGKILYKKGSVDVSKLGVGFNLGASIALNAELGFSDKGFDGKGGLSLLGAQGIGLQFHYYKVQGGKDIGAQFTVGDLFQVPIGPVKWDMITGGFNVNTATEVYSINAGGRFALIADQAGILTLTKSVVQISSMPSGPVIDASTNATLFNSWQVGSAKGQIDLGNLKLSFTGEFGGGFKVVPGIPFEAKSSVQFAASGGSDKYIYASTNTHASLLGIFDQSVYLAVGYNAPSSIDPYLAKVPKEVLSNGRIYGGYFGAHSKIGVLKKDAKTLGFSSLADVKLWYGNESEIAVCGNIKSGYASFEFAQQWDAGAEADFVGFDVASAAISLGGSLKAVYNGDWNIDGKVSGSLEAHIGCNGDCNDIAWACGLCPIPCGVKICGSASLGVKYNSKTGFSFDPSVF